MRNGVVRLPQAPPATEEPRRRRQRPAVRHSRPRLLLVYESEGRLERSQEDRRAGGCEGRAWVAADLGSMGIEQRTSSGRYEGSEVPACRGGSLRRRGQVTGHPQMQAGL